SPAIARGPPADRESSGQRSTLAKVLTRRRCLDRHNRRFGHTDNSLRGTGRTDDHMSNNLDLPEAIDRQDPASEINCRAEAYRNWGRWGQDDRLGTLNFIDDAKRLEAAALVRIGRAISLSQSFDMNGPQKGWRRRTNPVHTMLDTGTDAERGSQGFPHGIGGADDVIAMPLQCSTQWDGLGHIFDRGMAWNGRRAGDVVTSDGD